MKVGIVTFEKFHGRKTNSIGSSRIRAYNLVKYWEEASIYKHAKKYDVLIFQKAYWIEMAKKFEGIKILDLCDPDFLDWHYNIKEMADNCDAITCSTEALANDVVRFVNCPVWMIPDREDILGMKDRKIHIGPAKHAVWFGYAQNFPLLDSAVSHLYKYNLSLIVISNGIYVLPSFAEKKIDLINYKWTPETADDDIKKGDIVLNPKSTNGIWKYKSNNKTLHAWNLGLPVVQFEDEINQFVSADNRKKEAELRLAELKEKWDIEQSVEEYKNLIEEIKKDKNIG